jgi:hypothetical protein
MDRVVSVQTTFSFPPNTFICREASSSVYIVIELQCPKASGSVTFPLRVGRSDFAIACELQQAFFFFFGLRMEYEVSIYPSKRLSARPKN